jgi:RNA polymerase sigma-70 factor (ECF subfamily)
MSGSNLHRTLRTNVRQHTSVSAGENPASTLLAEAAFRRELVAMMPFLSAFAACLCRDRELARDLAQETLAKAWQARASFRPGSNLKAWLFTILRNALSTHRRRAWRQVNCGDAGIEPPGAENPQEWAVMASDALRALRALPPEQHKAILLVGLGGFSYADAAVICGCPEGTIKSRVIRARKGAQAALERCAAFAPARPPVGAARSELLRELDAAAA